MLFTKRPAGARSLRVTLPLASLLLLAVTATAEDRKKFEWNPLPIGKELPDFETKDLDGKPFKLSTARAIDKDSAFAAVAVSARAVSSAKRSHRPKVLSTSAWSATAWTS